MKRRQLLFGLLGLTAAAPALRLMAGQTMQGEPATGSAIEPIKKSEDEWRKLLSSKEFYVLREEGTEASGSSPLLKEKREGQFVCAACALPLFESKWKYHSGTGWPSFWSYIDGHLGFKRDWRLIWPRTEYHCARCGGHQGHVFDDGPKPTGKRYCNNGVALDFKPV
ncbi:MAG: peptide-methionine (R)-S-oxide reductase MsrB [Salinisphaera sp.]|nr:peptide-methionine (R)-S-oxide reductase MsrB [Salinisphaera sp.]MDN5937131.1 peptide-methionine (R)-S-oxide reductase MsrB [Salinisphaera sp.]